MPFVIDKGQTLEVPAEDVAAAVADGAKEAVQIRHPKSGEKLIIPVSDLGAAQKDGFTANTGALDEAAEGLPSASAAASPPLPPSDAGVPATPPPQEPPSTGPTERGEAEALPTVEEQTPENAPEAPQPIPAIITAVESAAATPTAGLSTLGLIGIDKVWRSIRKKLGATDADLGPSYAERALQRQQENPGSELAGGLLGAIPEGGIPNLAGAGIKKLAAEALADTTRNRIAAAAAGAAATGAVYSVGDIFNEHMLGDPKAVGENILARVLTSAGTAGAFGAGSKGLGEAFNSASLAGAFKSFDSLKTREAAAVRDIFRSTPATFKKVSQPLSEKPEMEAEKFKDLLVAMGEPEPGLNGKPLIGHWSGPEEILNRSRDLSTAIGPQIGETLNHLGYDGTNFDSFTGKALDPRPNAAVLMRDLYEKSIAPLIRDPRTKVAGNKLLKMLNDDYRNIFQDSINFTTGEVETAFDYANPGGSPKRRAAAVNAVGGDLFGESLGKGGPAHTVQDLAASIAAAEAQGLRYNVPVDVSQVHDIRRSVDAAIRNYARSPATWKNPFTQGLQDYRHALTNTMEAQIQDPKTAKIVAQRLRLVEKGTAADFMKHLKIPPLNPNNGLPWVLDNSEIMAAKNALRPLLANPPLERWQTLSKTYARAKAAEQMAASGSRTIAKRSFGLLDTLGAGIGSSLGAAHGGAGQGLIGAAMGAGAQHAWTRFGPNVRRLAYRNFPAIVAGVDRTLPRAGVDLATQLSTRPAAGQETPVFAAGGTVPDTTTDNILSPADLQQMEVLAMLEQNNSNTKASLANHASTLVRSGPKAGDTNRSETAPGVHKTLSGGLAAHERHAKHLVGLRPEALANSLEDLTGSLVEHAPEVAQSVNVAATRAVQFLQSKLPSPKQAYPLGPSYQPSAPELASYSKYRAAVEDPAHLLKQVAAGTISPEAVEAVKMVYPEMYAEMQEHVMQAVANHGRPDYQARTNISRLFGTDVDGSHQNSQVLLQQSQMPSEKPEESQGARPRPELSHVTIGQRTAPDDAQEESV